jgi:hypothetical protein
VLNIDKKNALFITRLDFLPVQRTRSVQYCASHELFVWSWNPASIELCTDPGAPLDSGDRRGQGASSTEKRAVLFRWRKGV